MPTQRQSRDSYSKDKIRSHPPPRDFHRTPPGDSSVAFNGGIFQYNRSYLWPNNPTRPEQMEGVERTQGGDSGGTKEKGFDDALVSRLADKSRYLPLD
ncbi:hypothetical protein QFC19_008589 [Naganishia cerealis]|uniref:Uncharacterized protein n=1 Tax=Naganishia cerealis TaxID=610337 RepID=A0ACC2V1Q9_9TREE|nr:hypothetical protein QFC19_008589 [Naganishia cerealis]